MGNEGRSILGFLLGDKPVYDPSDRYSPYTLEDFRSFYEKICSQLSENDSKMAFELSKSSENDIASHSNLIGSLGRDWHPNLPRPFDGEMVKEAKRDYLHGLLCGVSLDYLEVIADEFSFGLAEEMELGNNEGVLYLWSGLRSKERVRDIDDFFKESRRLVGDGARYFGFISHHVDQKNYALVGKRLPEEEYRKRLHEWELDVNWDGN